MIKESEETEDSSDFCDQLEYVSDINEQEAELVPYAQNNLPNFDEFSSESVLNNGYSGYIRAYKFNKKTNIRTIDSVDLYIVWVVMIIFNATKASTDNSLELSENGHPITQPSNDTSSEHLANSDPSVDDNYMIVTSNVPRHPTNPTASGWISENGYPVTCPSNDVQSTQNISISSPIRLEPFHVPRQPEYEHDVDNILNSVSIRNVRTESPDNPTTRCNSVTSSECSQITRHLLVGRGQEQSEQNASNWRQRGTEPSPTVRLQNIRQNRSNIRWDTGLQLPCAMQGTGLFQDTCTVDNFLTIVYLSLLDRALRQMCQTSAPPYDKTLYNIYISIENGRFDEARQHWLRFISHPRSSGSLYGTERKIIHGHVTHSCDASNFCKRYSCTCLRESLSTGAIQLARHQHFRQMYNRTTDRQDLLQTLIDSEVQRIQTYDSDMLGITRRIHENRNRCRFCRRVFEPQSPVFLTIDVEQIKDHLGNIDSVPEIVHFNGQR
ncbi:hypothetical protein FSP39_024391 [Pinctada imbricata]|uniref:Uncharacterized protein n=1 Tax=Pinctada imbricata TaxID=66713 RepID=A0AA88Y5J7_PINIB|nr:hypothetical protein FSP39_024391 [Pinctada imbricata]